MAPVGPPGPGGNAQAFLKLPRAAQCPAEPALYDPSTPRPSRGRPLTSPRRIPKVGDVLQHHARILLLQQVPVHRAMLHDQFAVAGEVDIDDLDIRGEVRGIIMTRQRPLDRAVAAFVVDRLNLQMRILGIVGDMEQAEMPGQPRAEILQDEVCRGNWPTRRAARSCGRGTRRSRGNTPDLHRSARCRCALCPSSSRSRARRD